MIGELAVRVNKLGNIAEFGELVKLGLWQLGSHLLHTLPSAVKLVFSLYHQGIGFILL
jgi:hypothetical protein